MSINQANKDKPVVCISCGKMIAKGHIESGSIEIACKCGVKNRIEAENKPEGQRKVFTLGRLLPNGEHEAIEAYR